MSEIITAVYENGILRPLSPVSLPPGSTVRLQVLAVEPANEDERIIQSLIAAGLITPPPHRPDVEPVSEERSTT